MSNSIVVLYSTNSKNEKSTLSWKYWCEKFNHKLLSVDLNKNEDLISRYLIYDVLEEQNINYDSVLMVSDTTFITPNCNNFIDGINKKMYARWFGSYGNLFEIMSLDENLKLDIDNWINTDLIFLPKKDLKELKGKIYNSQCINFISKFSNILTKYNELYDLPLNIVPRNVSEEIQISYYYNTCNMHINELLFNLKFLKLNPYIVNFNALSENDTSYFLNETYKHYFS